MSTMMGALRACCCYPELVRDGRGAVRDRFDAGDGGTGGLTRVNRARSAYCWPLSRGPARYGAWPAAVAVTASTGGCSAKWQAAR
jgi:hypothetical protein